MRNPNRQVLKVRKALELIVQPLCFSKKIFGRPGEYIFDYESKGKCQIEKSEQYDIFGISLFFSFSSPKETIEEIIDNSTLFLYVNEKEYFRISPLHPIIFHTKEDIGFIVKITEREFDIFIEKSINKCETRKDAENIIDRMLENCKYFDLRIEGIPLPAIGDTSIKLVLTTHRDVSVPVVVYCLLYGVEARVIGSEA